MALRGTPFTVLTRLPNPNGLIHLQKFVTIEGTRHAQDFARFAQHLHLDSRLGR